MKNFTKSLQLFAALLLAAHLLQAQENRSLDGSGNNILNPGWGAAGANQLTPGTIGFEDGISAPAGADRPNARHLSNLLFMQNTLTDDPRGLSAYCWVWGQFIDHDVTLVTDHPTESLDIEVPPFDAFFDPGGTGAAVIPMKRSHYDPASGTSPANPRSFVNSISAYIDASMVYGSEAARAAWLRTYSKGKLKTSDGNLLPWNTTTGEFGAPIDPVAPEMAMPLPFVQKFFVAGDVRANENPFLVSMHTLFVREHNRLCDSLAVANPSWTDEQLYQKSRKLVGSIMQAIVFEEWLPTLGIEVPAWSGYVSSLNGGILNVFSAAAFRYGHTTINSLLLRMDNAGNHLPQGDILLRDAFFNPTATQEVGGIEPYLLGMSTVVQQDFDCKVIDDLRNFLFGPPGAGGMDLAAININRGRDRGLPDYNTVRSDFGLPPVASFAEITADPLMNQSLEFAYGDVNKIDPWVGMLAEDHMPDALFGKTAQTIVGKQFLALRDGDRYFYENDLYLWPAEKAWIKQTRLADVIRRNTSATAIQDQVFMAQSLVSGTAENGNPAGLDFLLFPNPASEYFSLQVGMEKPASGNLRVFDTSGRMVVNREVELSQGTNRISVDLPTELPGGIYQVVLQANGKTGARRLLTK